MDGRTAGVIRFMYPRNNGRVALLHTVPRPAAPSTWLQDRKRFTVVDSTRVWVDQNQERVLLGRQ